MGEHAGRYRRLAEALVDAGYVVYANDHRGHGRTAGSADAHGDLGASGWDALVGDLGTLAALARAEHPGIPLVAFGHSMGSFALQQYLLDHSADVEPPCCRARRRSTWCAGDRPDQGGRPDRVQRWRSQPARTDYDWLSRDEAEVDAYVADPDCGFGLDPAATAGMLAARRRHRPDVAGVRADLPIYLLSGDADPLAGGGPLVELVADRYREAGVGDVTCVLYPRARHEIAQRDQPRRGHRRPRRRGSTASPPA